MRRTGRPFRKRASGKAGWDLPRFPGKKEEILEYLYIRRTHPLSKKKSGLDQLSRFYYHVSCPVLSCVMSCTPDDMFIFTFLETHWWRPRKWWPFGDFVWSIPVLRRASMIARPVGRTMLRRWRRYVPPFPLYYSSETEVAFLPRPTKRSPVADAFLVVFLFLFFVTVSPLYTYNRSGGGGIYIIVTFTKPFVSTCIPQSLQPRIARMHNPQFEISSYSWDWR